MFILYPSPQNGRYIHFANKFATPRGCLRDPKKYIYRWSASRMSVCPSAECLLKHSRDCENEAIALEVLVRRLVLKMSQIDDRTRLGYYVSWQHLRFAKVIKNWFLAYYSQPTADQSIKKLNVYSMEKFDHANPPTHFYNISKFNFFC